MGSDRLDRFSGVSCGAAGGWWCVLPCVRQVDLPALATRANGTWAAPAGPSALQTLSTSAAAVERAAQQESAARQAQAQAHGQGQAQGQAHGQGPLTPPMAMFQQQGNGAPTMWLNMAMGGGYPQLWGNGNMAQAQGLAPPMHFLPNWYMHPSNVPPPPASAAAEPAASDK